ncbi:hypothetical protein MBRA_01371 [Methylobacterium brachiatum]|nr:hypothetical protein MBRA_01371 [Methylobacterium brachiatum]
MLTDDELDGLARAVAALGDEDARRLDEAVRDRRAEASAGLRPMIIATTTPADGTVKTLTSKSVTYMEPQVATVPLSLSARPHAPRWSFDLQDDLGPFKMAKASRQQGLGRTEVLVYAYEAHVAMMDLSSLRLAGEPCEVGPWEPWDTRRGYVAGAGGITGPILRPDFNLTPGAYGYEVELTHFMPVVAERTVTRIARRTRDADLPQVVSPSA